MIRYKVLIIRGHYFTDFWRRYKSLPAIFFIEKWINILKYNTDQSPYILRNFLLFGLYIFEGKRGINILEL